MIPYEHLPALNAGLNFTCTLLLLAGWAFVRRKRVGPHKACMLAAFAVSMLFLASYLIYHAKVGSKPYQGQGALRRVYFTILITHIVLAILNLPLILTVLYRAWKGDFERHRRLARWTLPSWLYVSVTGVVVYLMLY